MSTRNPITLTITQVIAGVIQKYVTIKESTDYQGYIPHVGDMLNSDDLTYAVTEVGYAWSDKLNCIESVEIFVEIR